MGTAVRTSTLVGLLAALAALVGIDARATYGARVSGDEPQYLLTATSLGEDGDLDIRDELAARRFEPYHEIDLDPQTMPLDESGRQISPHDPLLPALLAIPMRVGGWAAAKVVLALIAGLTAAVTTWVAIRRFRLPGGPAAIGVASAFVGIPLAAYGAQVYPEMPAALAVIGAVAVLSSPRRAWRHEVAAIGAVVALPWLAVKYVPVAAVLAVAVLIGARSDRRRVVVLAASMLVAGAVFLVAHQRWYGGWTVYATGDHFSETGELAVVGTQVDLVGRARRLVGLLVDRDFGLAAWSPVWLLAPFGLGLLVSGGRPGRWIVVGALAAGWLNATFVALTMHGFWVPGRQIVVVLPLAALGVAAVASRSRVWLIAVSALGAAGLVNWCWLALEASTDRRTLIVDFAETASWPHRALRAILPAGWRSDAWTVPLLAVWAFVIVATAVLGWTVSGRVRSSRTTPRPDDRAPAPAGRR